MLHIINKSPFSSPTLTTCLQLALPESSLLFIEEAVYATLKNSLFASEITAATTKHKIFALKPDLEARGLLGKCMQRITVITYDEFVDLALKHPKIVNW